MNFELGTLNLRREAAVLFVKMHGAGNDFLLLDLLAIGPAAAEAEGWADLAREICDRHFGVGADGLLVLLPSSSADLRMRIFNSDGSEAESCGNGIRCVGRYFHDQHGGSSDVVRIETLAGLSPVQVHADGRVSVEMGPPLFKPEDIPVAVKGEDALDLTLHLGSESLSVGCVSMGNPHAVAFVPGGTLDQYPLETLGPAVERHPLFPQRVNFGVCEVLDGRRIRVRVWERGAGPTLACGTGACASVVVGQKKGRVAPGAVEVGLPGGELTIHWDGLGSVQMTGPAEYVFTGSYSAESHGGGEPRVSGRGVGWVGSPS